MDRMNFYKCNLIFIGLVRVQGLTYSFHKSFILDTRYLTLKSLFYSTFPFFREQYEKDVFHTRFRVRDNRKWHIPALPGIYISSFFRNTNNTLEGCGIVFQDIIVVQSHHHHHWRDRREAKCKKKAITHTPFKEEDSRHKISNNNCSCQRTEEARKANVCIRASFLSDIPGLAIYSDGVSAYTRNINLIWIFK